MAVNVARGLFRSWVVITVLWTVGACFLTYSIREGDIIRGAYQPAAAYKKAGPYADKEVLGPFYELIRSPSADGLPVTFNPVSYADQSLWEKDEKMLTVKMPDESRIFMTTEYNPADRTYISKQFWDQRWWRWGNLAVVALLWSVGPMLLLFCVGYAFLWVGRGFSR